MVSFVCCFFFYIGFTSLQVHFSIIYLCVFSPSLLSFLFAFIFPINGKFFKFMSHLTKNSTLKSFISTADEYQNLLYHAFENQYFKDSLVYFYKTLQKMNISESDNKIVKEHFTLLNNIIQSNDKYAFFDFFIKNFTFDFRKYSSHKEVLKILEHFYSLIPSQQESLANDDLIIAMQENFKFKDKFKKIL